MPRPPVAPRSSAVFRHPARVVHLDSRRPVRRWQLGPETSPALEAVVVSRWARVRQALLESTWFLVGYLLLVGGYSIWGSVSLGQAGWLLVIFSGLTVWWRWRACRHEFPPPIVAGADWIGRGRRRRSRWLPTYELTRIEVTEDRDSGNEPVTGTVAVILRSGDQPGLWVDLALLQTNPALWDLVHHGITESVAAGAELTEEARRVLRRP